MLLACLSDGFKLAVNLLDAFASSICFMRSSLSSDMQNNLGDTVAFLGTVKWFSLVLLKSGRLRRVLLRSQCNLIVKLVLT